MRKKDVTKDWIRNRSDEIAVARGCRFNPSRAQHVIDFIQGNLCLYEGETAGQLVKLMPWQIDFLSRLFGWERYSEQYKRWVRRFRKASLWIPKKNGKSPTAAMVGLYLLAADGEQGQKVFSAAKDGQQAQIMHKHAERMTEKSARLSAECTINLTTHTIRHRPTNSEYRILSGDNITGQEGINGSVIIDETHVVDARLAGVLEYAGASRSEPIHLEVSTAGDNPLGYGMRQWKYGQQVESGERDDIEFLHVAYAAPQDATDEICGQVETWKAANPSWGYTISPEEFEASHKRASRSLSDFATFKKYRLNIWQTSASPWIRIDDWQRCAKEFTPDDLNGQVCFAGLDLARTRDTTALVLLFPQDGRYRLLSHFWLPENTARNMQSEVPYLDWSKGGHITLTPGDVCDYGFIYERIRELSERYVIQQLAFDPYNAEELTQRIEGELGIERIAFGQTITNFAGPTSEFERQVIDGTIEHNSNPVMNWQVGNAEVRIDQSGNKRPVKPDKESNQKIDGVVAAIMALGRAMHPDNAGAMLSEVVF